MAATTMEALADVYEAVTPALPRLYQYLLPVTANRAAMPYSLLIQAPGVDDLRVQGNAAVNGTTGTVHEVFWARFLIWSKVPADTDAHANALTDALKPFSVVVTGAKTVTTVLDTSVFQERKKPPRITGRPIARDDEATTDRVYVATVDVKVRLVYA